MDKTKSNFVIEDEKLHADQLAVTAINMQSLLANCLTKEQKEVVIKGLEEFTANIVILKMQEVATFLVDKKLADKDTVNGLFDLYTNTQNKYSDAGVKAMHAIFKKANKISKAIQETLKETGEIKDIVTDEFLKNVPNLKRH